MKLFDILDCSTGESEAYGGVRFDTLDSWHTTPLIIEMLAFSALHDRAGELPPFLFLLVSLPPPYVPRVPFLLKFDGYAWILPWSCCNERSGSETPQSGSNASFASI